MKPIAIDASRYRFPTPTGVEVYSNYIIDELIQHARTEKIPITLLSNKDLGFPEYKKNENQEMVTQKLIPGKYLWTLIFMTKYFIFHHKEFSSLFVPSHILPLCFPKKGVLTIHDVAHRHFSTSYSKKQWWILELSTWFAVKFAHKIIAVSHATKNDLIKLYSCPEEKIEVIHLGFDLEKFKQSYTSNIDIQKHYGLENRKYLMFVGRIEEKKNIPLLVEAFLNVNISQNWKLVLVGKDGYGAEKVTSLLERDVEHRVYRLGFQNNHVTYSLLQQASGFIFPSKFEGFGLPVLEAYALGVPVLCSTAGALPEVAGDAAYFIGTIPHAEISLEMLKKSIETFVLTIEQGKVEKKNMGYQLKHFSWSFAGDQTWQILSH